MSVGFNACRRVRVFAFCVVWSFILLGAISVSALNLPEDAPILISQPNSTRALVTVSNRRGVNSSIKIVQPSRQNVITFYLTNVKDLLEGEGATA